MKSERLIACLNRGLRLASVPVLCATLAACGTTTTGSIETPKPKARTTEYFPESVYGVKASPRVATGKHIPKGGGRDQTGKPYQVKGRWYVPKAEPGYNKVGMSSWYGSAFHGRLTANGEVYDSHHLSAAHPTFPLPSYARVTNTENGTSVVVRVNDRGPYEYGRILDVSSKTAELLDMKRKGTAKVRVQYIGRAPLEGNDMPFLMASYVTKGDRSPSSMPEGQIATGVMVASNAPFRPADEGGGDTGAPVNALVAPTKMAATASLDAVMVLPQIGPVPLDRPEFIRVPVPDGSFASAFQEVRSRQTVDPFGAVLSSQQLTADAIRAFARRYRSAR